MILPPHTYDMDNHWRLNGTDREEICAWADLHLIPAGKSHDSCFGFDSRHDGEAAMIEFRVFRRDAAGSLWVSDGQVLAETVQTIQQADWPLESLAADIFKDRHLATGHGPPR